MWRWTAQSAIREGQWKLLRGGEREYLYDLAADPGEKHNLAARQSDIAGRLRAKLTAWCSELSPPGLALGPMAPTWNNYFDFYLEGKTVDTRRSKPKGQTASSHLQGWQARNGTLTVNDGALQVTSEKGPQAKAAFLTHSQFKAAGPLTVKLAFKTSATGQAAIAWRTSEQKDFVPENRAAFQVTASDKWQTQEINLPASGTLIHLRLHLPGATVLVRQFELQPATGKLVSLWR